MSKRLPAVVAIGAIGLVAASCSSGGTTSSPPTTAAPTSSGSSATQPTAPGTTGRTAKLAKGDKYVALGSSIASGYGISVQSTDCGRSNRNYPNLIAAKYGLALTDVTCGAATIPNVVDKAQGANPPQITAVAPDTKLITLTVGGNDIGYNATAVGCSDPASVCSAPADLDAKVASTKAALVSLLDQLHTIAPSATIVMTTYPREVPPGNCPELSYSDEEATTVRTMGEKLEGVFVEVSTRPDLVFIDPYPAPGDHTGCAPAAERWTAGAVPDDGFAYHPTALGHQTMAQMIETALGT